MKASGIVDHSILGVFNTADVALSTAGVTVGVLTQPQLGNGTTTEVDVLSLDTIWIGPCGSMVIPTPLDLSSAKKAERTSGFTLEAFDLPGGSVGFNAEMPMDPASPEKRVAPREFKIMNRGLTRVRKGGRIFNLLLDEQAEKDIFASMGEQGREQLPMDYDHGMLGMISGPESSASAGWFSVELRADGLYASSIEWTSRALKAIEDREYRFTSPAVMLEETDEVGMLRVTELINVALTNLPATIGQKPLVASAKQTAEKQEVLEDMDKKLIRKMLGLAEDATDEQVSAKVAELSAAAKAADEAKAASAAAKTEAEKRGASLTSMTSQLAALDAKAKVADQLGAKVAELEALQTRQAWQSAFDAGDREGKLPKSLHAWAQTQTVEQLSAFIAAAPVVHGGRTHAPAQGSGTPDQLSVEEREVCKQLGINRQVFAQAKKDQAQGDSDESAWTAPADGEQKFTSRYISAYRSGSVAK